MLSAIGALILLFELPCRSALVHAKTEGATELREASLAHAKFEWDTQNRLPPWLSSITEGSDQAIAVLLGQSLKPDGSAPQVLQDRAELAKKLLQQKAINKVIVSGSDPAGAGHTEAYMTAQVLMSFGIPADAIIQECQATTTAENAWFSLRWIPRGTGKVYLITSDFHMPRATYIFQAVYDHFYMTMEEKFKDDPLWESTTKRYPRLQLIQAPTASLCGSNASLARDLDPTADINSFSLAKRARDELRFLGSGEVTTSLYGPPLSPMMYIWPVQINATKDPANSQNFEQAMAQSMNTAEALCACVAPPGPSEPRLAYPLRLPAPRQRDVKSDWQTICPAPERAAK